MIGVNAENVKILCIFICREKGIDIFDIIGANEEKP